MLTASLRPHTFDSFLRERLASEAARSSSATASTPCAISSASARLRRYSAGAFFVSVLWATGSGTVCDMRRDKVALKNEKDRHRVPVLRSVVERA
jgi:hypothetical protein